MGQNCRAMLHVRFDICFVTIIGFVLILYFQGIYYTLPRFYMGVIETSQIVRCKDTAIFISFV